jgi:hypothetical protein
MKRYTSRVFKSIAMFFMAFPVVYLLVAAVVFDIPAHLCVRMLLSPQYYLLSFVSAVAGFGLWEAKRWAWYVFLLANVFALYFTAVVALEYGESNHKLLAFLVYFGLTIGVIARVGREVRVPYFLPKIRWWENNPRYKLVVPVEIVRTHGERLAGEILDLSMTGCFVKLRTELPTDERVSLEFEIFSHRIHGSGLVVWKTQSTVTHPKGIGIKFEPFERHDRRLMRAIQQRLRKIAAFYRSSRYLISQEDFLKRYEELQTTRLTKTGRPK